MTNGKHPHTPKGAAKKKPPAKAKGTAGRKSRAAKAMTKDLK